MCRLVAGYAWGPRGARLLGELAVLAAEAARGDPYLRAVTGGEDRHCHGYGLVLAIRGRGEAAWRLIHERYDALDGGLGEEEACRSNLEAARGAAERLRGVLANAEEAFLVFHVRRAGRSEPRGSLNAHPYVAAAAAPGGQLLLYLAHNGGVRKEPLARELGLEPGAYTDSNLLLLWLARRLAQGADAAQALAEGYRLAKSGYDVALLAARDTGRGAEPGLYIAAGYAPGLDEARRAYYEPIGFAAEEAAGYTSSTIRDLAREKGIDATMEALEHRVYRVTRRGLEPAAEYPTG